MRKYSGDSDEYKSFIINNSTIEFAVVGPIGKRNGILIRSQNLKINLIGFASLGDEKPKSLIKTTLYDVLFFYLHRKMWSVNSFPLDQISNKFDDRRSKYRFYWIGFCSKSRQKLIQNIFDRQILDILIGIEEGNIEQIEWSLAPVVFSCSEIHEYYLKKNLEFRAILAVYVALTLTAAILVLIRNVLVYK